MKTFSWRPLKCPKCDSSVFKIWVIDYTETEPEDSDPQDIMCKCDKCNYEFVATYSS